MIEIRIKHREYKAYLVLENKITVIVGESASGKSTIHKVLDNFAKYDKIKVSESNFTLENINNTNSLKKFIKDGALQKNIVYIIDEGHVDIDDEVAEIIKHSTDVYIIITSRTELGKLNFRLSAIKVLKKQPNGIIVLEDYVKLGRM